MAGLDRAFPQSFFSRRGFGSDGVAEHSVGYDDHYHCGHQHRYCRGRHHSLYLHRFREEIKTDSDYYKTLHRCHNTIGHAMYYTSVTIIIGFSILVLSNFWPTIYFGLFTSMAMLIALIASLTLLPLLLVLFKPFGPDARSSVEMGMG